MNLESSSDISYCVNPRLVSTIRTADSVVIRGAGDPFELSLPLFQLLAVFVEARTVQQAFDALDVDVEVSEFTAIVHSFVDRGLLQGDRPVDGTYDLQHILNPEVFAEPGQVDRLGSWLRQGRAIIIPDALPRDFAEDVHRDLSQSKRWTMLESGHDFFHFRVSAISELEGHTPALTKCSRLFRSAATRRFIAGLSGHDCAGLPHVAAGWYRPGEYALPHNDTGVKGRSVAYVWYLTKDWRQEWGGAFFWCPTGQYVLPAFNALMIFNVVPANLHLVCPVAPTATAKRLTVNGFWCRSEVEPGSTPLDPSAATSPRAYGPVAPAESAGSPVTVL